MRKSIFIILLFVVCLAIPAEAKEYPFQGVLDFENSKLDFVLELGQDSLIEVKALKNTNQDFRFFLKVKHLKTSYFDWSSQIESVVEVLNDHVLGATFAGELRSQYSLIDYKPIEELSGKFKVKDDKLFLTSISYGNLKCDGSVGLVYPFKVNLGVGLKNIFMDDFLNFWVKNKGYDSGGIVSGDIKISGPLQRLSLRGNLKSTEGFIKSLEYNNISLKMDGVYPKMFIKESFLSKADGVTFSFDGLFDLSDHKNFKKQIKQLNLYPIVNESDLQKEWTIKRTEQEGGGVTELKYLFRKNEEFGWNTGEDLDMFGIEQSMEF